MRSSAVSRSHFAFTFPLTCLQLPSTWSQFMAVPRGVRVAEPNEGGRGNGRAARGDREGYRIDDSALSRRLPRPTRDRHGATEKQGRHRSGRPPDQS